MSSLLEKWVSYCEGIEKYESADFVGLLKSHSTPEELVNILRYFPHSDAIQFRLSEVLNAGSFANRLYLVPVQSTSDETLMIASENWLSERAKFCEITGNQRLSSIASSVTPRFIKNYDDLPHLQRDLPERWMFDHISDEFWDALPFSKGPVFGLLEAFYGIAADYYLAWYIATPLLDFKLDCSKYFELWRQGGTSILTDSELLVSRCKT